MSRFHAYYAKGISLLIASTAGVLIGLHLTRWIYLRSPQLRQSRSAMFQVHFPATPDPAATATWAELFNTAKSEIWLSAGRLESITILEALGNAAQRGVQVHLTLSVGDNPTSAAGARAWLRDKTTIRDVGICHAPFSGAACVVDGKDCVVTAQGLLPIEANSRDGGIFLYATGSEVARPLLAWLQAQHANSDPESDPP